MSDAPPKAIKSFVSEVVKPKVLESNDDFVDRPEIPVMALLKMELVQRGVLVSLKDDDITQWDVAKTLHTVRSSIGKPLLEEGSIPTPLLAGLAMMAGRTAELCASLCGSRNSNPLAIHVQSALERCKEIKDERFQALLEIFNPKSDGDWNPAAQANCLQLLAEGYYSRGTRLQPDLPQMWKKACDLILLCHDRQGGTVPGDAAPYFENMSRIAQSKGNTQRAAELSLRATEAYLEMANCSSTTPPTSSTASLRDKVAAAYVDPYKVQVKNPLGKAEETIQFCQGQEQLLTPVDAFVMKLVKAQLRLSQEDLAIEEESQKRQNQARNRAVDNNNNNKSSKGKNDVQDSVELSKIRDQARCHVLARVDPQQHLQGGDVVALSFAFCLAKEGNQETRPRAAKVLTQVIERNRDRVTLLSRKGDRTGWSTLTEYILLFLKKHVTGVTKVGMEESVRSWSDEEVNFLETCFTTVPYILWMNCNSRNDFPDDLISRIAQMLEILKERAEKARFESQASSTVLKSSAEPIDAQISQLLCAHASMQAWWHISQAWDPSQTSEWKKHSELALSMAQQYDKYEEFSARYGTSFLNFLVAWSGLSRAPWSFCTITDARLIWTCAQNCLARTESDLGRRTSPVERLALLELAKADMECGILSGGFASEASKTFRSILDRTTVLSDSEDKLQKLIQSKCWIGLARLALYSGYNSDVDGMDPTTLAKKSLEALLPHAVAKEERMPTFIFSHPVSPSFTFHISVSRQLVADALVRSGRSQEARVFLEDAVRESPLDAEVVLSLGAFLLRESRSPNRNSNIQSDINDAKTQLLKSAKLDSRKAGPFSLLGFWYEAQKDSKRALGCYSKALLLDPPNPVAGRGFLRLAGWDSAKAILDAAIQSNSPVNGWAWRAVANDKVMFAGENDLGVIALLKALRSRDISEPQNELLSPFYGAPTSLSIPHLENEKADTWSELAFAYRLLGRYTAAIRSYQASIEAAGDKVAARVLCACAEAELGLGLAEQAAEKYGRALQIGDSIGKPVAAFGQARALLALAQRDAEDGKFGVAKRSIMLAIDGFETSSTSTALKLLGDIYSFGALLPLYTFEDPANGSAISNQTFFVSQGEACFKEAAECVRIISAGTDEMKLLQAALITDAGTNVLRCAQLDAFQTTDGNMPQSANIEHQHSEVLQLFDHAKAEFSRAVKLCPDYAPAWCGIGCSAVKNDPILAQHAFCRSLHLDSLHPDPYANLGFLYMSHKSFAASQGVLNELTKVADSPMMWINRALIYERNASSRIDSGEEMKADEAMQAAADSYRAAIQIMRHPSALLGLALTCRGSRNITPYRAATALKESHGLLEQYKGKLGPVDASASILEGLVDLERRAGGNQKNTPEDEGKHSIEELTQKLVSHQQSTDAKNAELDAELIQKCLSSAAGSAWKAEPGMTSIVSTSIARQIVDQPDRGDLWVMLTRSLLRERGQSKVGLASASVSSGRAIHILMDQLTFPNQRNTDSRKKLIVNDMDLSEALAYDMWLDELNASNKEGSSSKIIQLQKALLIRPDNQLARVVLAEIEGQ